MDKFLSKSFSPNIKEVMWRHFNCGTFKRPKEVHIPLPELLKCWSKMLSTNKCCLTDPDSKHTMKSW